MGWKEAQTKYHKGLALTDQKAEDLVARRVLRGLGLVQRNVPWVMRSIFSGYDIDEPLWHHVQDILRYVFVQTPYMVGAANHWRIEIVPPN